LNDEILRKWNDVLSGLLHQRCFAENYELVKPIGEGNSCKVYLGRHKITNEECAVKVFDKKNKNKRSEVKNRLFRQDF
jgi:serine/threonine protein kinase